MSTAERVPSRLADMPLSAPALVWLGYGVALLTLIVADAHDGGPFGSVFAVVFTALFSFQFWVYAAWRGMRRRSGQANTETS